jgi:hypothetical protein
MLHSLTALRAGITFAQVPAPLGAFPVSYKYALRDSDGVLHMEHGENRTVSLPEGTSREALRWRAHLLSGFALPVTCHA